MPPASLEYRAGHEVLALTVFLSDVDRELSQIRVAHLEDWLSLTAHSRPWHRWAQTCLEDLAAEDARTLGAGSPDLPLARATWGWLQRTELLAADLGDGALHNLTSIGEEGSRTWLPAWELGLPLCHLAIHLF
jgi:hypothetical protein